MNIDPISNSRLTLVRKLNQKKYRYNKKRFLVEGARAVEQIMRNDKIEVGELFFDEAQEYWLNKPWSAWAREVKSSMVPMETYADVSDTDNPQGVMALCLMPAEISLERMAQEEGVIIASDAIQDPGNLGTIIRTASWFGAAGLLSGKGTVDLFHPKVVRSAAGATGSVSHANAELADALPVFESKGWEVVLLDTGSDAAPLQKMQKTEKTIIVIGNEANGIDRSLFVPGRRKVNITSPRGEGEESVESLNAAIALSIALYALS